MMVRFSVAVPSFRSDFSGIGDLESKLYRQLEIPIPYRSGSQTRATRHVVPEPIAAGIAELRRDIAELRNDASVIGRIPKHYPWHVVVIMKVISSLLPWYTRPLVRFGERSVQTMETMARLLDTLLQRQQSLMTEIEELKTSSPDPAGDRRNPPGSVR